MADSPAVPEWACALTGNTKRSAMELLHQLPWTLRLLLPILVPIPVAIFSATQLCKCIADGVAQGIDESATGMKALGKDD